MATETLTCPYCNAAIGATAGLSAGQRIVCPRCGDSFPLRPADAFTAQPPPAAPAETGITANPPAVQTAPARRTNRLIAAGVVGLMLLMGGVGLAFMLRTQDQRRAHDTSRPPRRPGRQPQFAEPDAPPPVEHVAPDKLAALGYLPADVNFLAAVRIPELLAGPVGVRLLRDPIQVGDSAFRLESLPGWVGLKMDDLDHFVFAARVEDSFPPPFYLVLRTAHRYDEEAMRQRLKGTRVAAAGGKKLYSFRTPRNDLPLTAWFADDRTLVLALFADQLKALPDAPAADLGRLREELRDVLTKRREAAPAWLAGHSRDWSKTSIARFLNQTKKDDVRRLQAVRTFGVWLVPDRDLQVKAVLGCKDDEAARELGDFFRSLHGGDGPEFKTALDGPWLLLHYQTDADFLSRLTKR